MKKIFYILSILLIPFLHSCEVENSENPYPKTLKAKLAYDYVNKSILQSIDLLDLMTKVSYYAEAPADKKDGIKNFFLSSYNITSTNNTWVLKNDNVELTFLHNNKSINESGALWTVTLLSRGWDGELKKIIEDKNFRVETMGNKDWKITTSNISVDYFYNESYKDNSTIYVKGTDAFKNSSNIYDFDVEKGSGIVLIDSNKISYNVLQSLTYSDSVNGYGSSFAALRGELDILLDSDKINVLITPSSYPVVKITYKGITETY